MDLATIQIKVDTREVKAANENIKELGTTGQMASKKVKAANDDMASSAKGTVSAFKLLGGAIAALGVGALISNFTKTVTESERLKGSLTTMTGSVANAAFAFGELEKFASQTPYTLDQSVEGFIKLKALGLDPSERALRSYGNTAAAMGKDLMQMVEAVADASTGEFERLKEFGIKASKEGDRVSLTFQGMTTTIGNSSQEIQEYLLQIGEVQFGSAMEDQMQRLPGLLSNLEDNVAALFRKLGDVGGIKLFSAAITGTSAVIVGITNNLDVLAIGLSAALAGFAAFSAGSIAASIVAGFGRMRTAVLALNLAIRANPIAFVASAITAAAVIIISKWDSIRIGAERAGVKIQIMFEKLKIFLMETFAGALNSITNLFSDIQNKATATMAAVAAAARDPLNAFETFNTVFEDTLAGLRSGGDSANVFGDSISASKSRVAELEGELETMNTQVETTDEVVGQAVPSLSDFAIVIDDSASGADQLAKNLETARSKTEALLGQISNETEALSMSSRELDIRNNLQKAGVDATSELGQEIINATNNFHDEKDAIDDAKEAADKLAESQKEVARQNEAIKSGISNFFMDLFENGSEAFGNLVDKFKAMTLQMIADWAASQIVETISGQFEGLGTSITDIFSGIFSSLGSALSSLVSGIVSAAGRILGLGGSGATSAATSAAASAAGSNAAGAGAGSFIGRIFGTGGGAAAGSAAASQAAIAAGTSTMAANAALAASTAGTAGASIAAGTSTMAANAAAAAASTSAAGGGAAAGSAAAGSSAFTNALATAGPYAAAIIAAYLVAKALDSGGTPTSTAGLTMAKTGGMSDANIFQMSAFESGFAPLGFKQNATNDQAEAAIAPLRALDSALTSITKDAGFNVNLSGHTFSGLGVEGSGPGTVLGMFIEEGKAKGKSIESQMDQYATEWINAVGVRNGVSDAAIRDIIGDGTAAGIVARAQAILDSQSNGIMGPEAPAGMDGSSSDSTGMTLSVNGSHRDGLDMVPYDGYVAELHAGERVQTAEQARASDNIADEMSGLRQSIEDVMVAVARNTSKLYRLNDRWDKNGLPPVRA